MLSKISCMHVHIVQVNVYKMYWIQDNSTVYRFIFFRPGEEALGCFWLHRPISHAGLHSGRRPQTAEHLPSLNEQKQNIGPHICAMDTIFIDNRLLWLFLKQFLCHIILCVECLGYYSLTITLLNVKGIQSRYK